MSIADMLSEKYRIQLNAQQTAAVNHNEGPALVLAGPGSGKTTVITTRTAVLCLDKGVNPRSILTMTFNRSAAYDMAHRFAKLFGDDLAHLVRFSTFHSFCNRIVMDYEKRQNQTFTRVEAEGNGYSKEKIVSRIYYSLTQKRIQDESLENLINEIGFVKNMMIKDFSGYDASCDYFQEVFLAYEKYKRDNLLIDFDDMLTYAYLILRTCPDILSRYSRAYSYLQIDEGQDLSLIQFKILDLLMRNMNHNLFVVADDDQSIYGFRGANAENIINISKIYPDCKIYKLEENYRSSENIVRISSQFIRKNGKRYDKSHFTENGELSNPVIHPVKDKYEQSKILAGSLERTASDETSAIIYRNNLSSIPIIDCLSRKGILFNLRQNKLRFFTNPVFQDILSILKFSINQNDFSSLSRFYYKIHRYISKPMMKFCQADNWKDSLINAFAAFPGLQDFQRKSFEKLKYEFGAISRMYPKDAINYIEKVLDYNKYLHDSCDKAHASYEKQHDIIETMECIAAGCLTVETFLERIEELKAIIKERSFVQKGAAITLTTIHSAKGLEFDNVYMIDLINREIPGFNQESMKEDMLPELEEERRLFYVAVTRAKKCLYLIYPKRTNDKDEPSSFLRELQQCMEPSNESTESRNYGAEKDEGFQVGMEICHPMYGTGKIIRVQKRKSTVILSISFSDKIRKFDLDYCIRNNILKINEP